MPAAIKRMANEHFNRMRELQPLFYATRT